MTKRAGLTGTSGTSAQPTGGARTRVGSLLRTFWPMLRPYRVRLLASAALVVAAPLLDTTQIWMFKLLIDDVLVPRNLAALLPVAVAYLGLGVAQAAGLFTDTLLAQWLAERFVIDLRVRVFDHLLSLSTGFFDRRRLGDTLARLTGDIDAIEALVVSGLTRTLSYACQIGFFAVALFVLDWRLGLAVLLAAPGFLLAARRFSARIRVASREQRRRAGAVTSAAEEVLGNIALVQAYDRRAAETARFRAENTGRFAAQMAATRLRALSQAVMELLEVCAVVLVVALGVDELRRGRLTLGELLVFVTYLGLLYSPVRGAGRLSNTVHTATASAERVIELLDRSPDVREAARPQPARRGRGELALTRVAFTYPGAPGPALRDITMTVHAGERVALVGPSGSGKSTVVKLLLRLHDPDSGFLTLDGQDLRDLDLGGLRARIGAVLQDSPVLDSTVRENISWGRPGATDAEVMAAAVAADAHEFITRLPEGYRTRVGQRGRLLSGGQRQRLAIARAVIRDAPVLVLDEPTTGLDAAAADRILAPLRRLTDGRTTLIISHDLRAVADADRILFLGGGRVTAAGTHAELLRSSPGYAELYLRRAVPDDDHPVLEPT